MFNTILLVVIVLALFAALPIHSFSSQWGYAPSGLIGTILLVWLVLFALRQALKPAHCAKSRGSGESPGFYPKPFVIFACVWWLVQIRPPQPTKSLSARKTGARQDVGAQAFEHSILVILVIVARRFCIISLAMAIYLEDARERIVLEQLERRGIEIRACSR